MLNRFEAQGGYDISWSDEHGGCMLTLSKGRKLKNNLFTDLFLCVYAFGR